MKNWKGDIIWTALLLVWILVLAIQETRSIFLDITDMHPYWGGFVKFFVLASMGDMLGVRIIKESWIIPDGFCLRAVLWGLLGLMVTLVFSVYTGGIASAQINLIMQEVINDEAKEFKTDTGRYAGIQGSDFIKIKVTGVPDEIPPRVFKLSVGIKNGISKLELEMNETIIFDYITDKDGNHVITRLQRK
jgi:hypothetical protein